MSSRASSLEPSVFSSNDFYTALDRRSGGHSQKIFSQTDFQKWRYVDFKMLFSEISSNGAYMGGIVDLVREF